MLALLHLLDFGSGYDDLLRQSTQRDAHETMQFGVLGMAISGKRLDAVFLKSFSDFAVANFFSFSSHEDQASPIPGVQISRPVRFLTGRLTGQMTLHTSDCSHWRASLAFDPPSRPWFPSPCITCDCMHLHLSAHVQPCLKPHPTVVLTRLLFFGGGGVIC